MSQAGTGVPGGDQMRSVHVPAIPVPAVHRAGEAAVMLDASDHPLGGLAGAKELQTALREAREAGVVTFDQVVPGAHTVLVRGGGLATGRDPAAALAQILARFAPASGDDGEAGEGPDPTVIPVVYDGGDLDEVADLTGFSAQEVVARHTGTLYDIAFTGFAPGFAYLSGGDPRIAVPRRSTPRVRIPSGAVALAGEYSGVYPRESPGGWQIIGHTELAMWDPDREDPATLVPGGTVQFEVTREHIRAVVPDRARAPQADSDVLGSGRKSGEHRQEPSTAANEPVLRTVDAGLGTVFQDGGRPQLADLGVSASGAADRPSWVAANKLVGNEPLGADPGPACLEIGVGGFAADVISTTVLALAGAPRRVRVVGSSGTREPGIERAFRVDPGERLEIGPPERGLRTLLAVRGGFDAPQTLGSRSADTLASLGPAALVVGQELAAASDIRGISSDDEAARGARPGPVGTPDPARPAAEDYPAAGETTVLRVVPGPRDDWFSGGGLDHFFSEPWEVTPHSDRVGVRLSGEPIPRAPKFRDRELPSEGLIRGSIQVPASGHPVLFLADHPLTGGYPVIATVIAADVALAAQLPQGAQVRFERFNPSQH